MNAITQLVVAARIALVAFGSAACAHAAARGDAPPVLAPPDSFFDKVREKDRAAARAFYKKFIDVKGLPVVAAGEVADDQNKRGRAIVHDHRGFTATKKRESFFEVTGPFPTRTSL